VELSSLPVTLEGLLVADVGEGDVDEDGEEGEYSEINFGTLTVGSTEIPVQESGGVLKWSGRPSAANPMISATPAIRSPASSGCET
jgi:hypothetical protein